MISGNASLTEAGRSVLVTFNDKQYSATFPADGSWNVTVQSTDVQAMGDGTYTYSATVSDAVVNSTTANGQVTLDANVANLPVLTVNAVTGDNIIDGAEIKAAQILNGSSLNLEAGQTVTVILNGKTYLTTVDNQGHWQVSVSAPDLAQLAQGQHTLEVSAQDKSGNHSSATHSFEVNTALSGIAIDPITGDDKLNLRKVAQNITVTGSSQNVAAGTSVCTAKPTPEPQRQTGNGASCFPRPICNSWLTARPPLPSALWTVPAIRSAAATQSACLPTRCPAPRLTRRLATEC